MTTAESRDESQPLKRGSSNSGPGGLHPAPEAGPYRWVVLGIVMMGTFMAILDSSIVNVALPHMMSAFGVNRDQIEWVSTAFMLASAVAMPLVGWLVGRMGHKRLYLLSLGLFTAGSAACALAWSLDAMIVARVIQALGGGAIQPVGMAIVSDLFAPHERGRALGIWGTGIMVGPAIGPTLGGYLTDMFNWRVIFSVNLPFGVLTLLFGLAYMKRDTLDARRRTPLDFWGFFFLSLALVAGLLGLSNGQDKGWTSSYVAICAALTAIGAILFIAVEATVEHPLLDLSLFCIPNFSASMALAIFRAVGLFGGVFLLPIFLENLVGYTTIQTGLWMMPGALAVGLMMPIAGRLADRYPPRWLVTTGVVATGLSLVFYGQLDPLSGPFLIIAPQILRGLGLGLMMAPLMTAALNAVPPTQVATVSSFLNVAQRVGGAFGIALLNTLVTQATHVHAVRMGAALPAMSTRFAHFAHQVQAGVSSGSDAATLAAESIYHRASVLGFENGFVFAGLILLAGLPLCFLLLPTVTRSKSR
jgi:EmrB/QacA subfamily drug resistance transporter